MPRVPLALSLLLVAPVSAAAQPSVRVRAEARIELRVGRDPGAVTVGGTLRDDLGQPLADRRVEVRVVDDAGQARGRITERTDSSGSLRASFPLEPGTYRIIARWEGDDGHQHVEVAQGLDLTRAHVRLVVGLGGAGRIDLDQVEHHVDVLASSDEGGSGLRIEIRDELDRPLAEGPTDAEGRARFTLASGQLGEPAAGRLLARTPGDDRRAPAQTEVPVVRFRPSSIEIAASSSRVESGDPVTVSGRLFDSAGPLTRRAVGLFANGAHVETVLTDDQGRFSRAIELADDGAVEIVASYASDAPWRTSARSTPVLLSIEAAGSPPWPWLLAPTLLCAVGVGWMSRRRRRGAPRRAIADAASTVIAGIEPTRASASADEARDLGGTVLDADEGNPIAGAVIALVGASGERLEIRADEDGRFGLSEVEGGVWRLHVTARGYQGTEAGVRVPHRGQWSAVRVRLRSLRQVALVGYRPVADALAPQRRWWAFWTPRELAGRAEASARPDVEALTADVERAAYAEGPPTDSEVESIAERAGRIAQALGDR